jgi:hypothetical protein
MEDEDDDDGDRENDQQISKDLIIGHSLLEKSRHHGPSRQDESARMLKKAAILTTAPARQDAPLRRRPQRSPRREE